ncbi:hypothetical protein QBC32DRAFT_133261 [Pseudoneurospora amorphoporcata]|uniref:Uncharacterized protein n=1 Tax=Pseudoneurospora amorphoporcata TaxID=241081 RepID=A0AAN6NK75_9PEZI|nr:hypothetical protein QBC32DRAFT_133261 [Pseudoneurospora amorphoporcata]
MPTTVASKWPVFVILPWKDSTLVWRAEFSVMSRWKLAFRLGYAVSTLSIVARSIEEDPSMFELSREQKNVKKIWKFVTLFNYLLLPSGDGGNSKEPHSERLCNKILGRICERREPEVKLFWKQLEKEGKLREEGEAGVGKVLEELKEGSPNAGRKWRVRGTPFDRGVSTVSRAISELSAYGKKSKVEFDVDAWQ